ncbi:hypothetical protein [Serratia liquefaciens]|uniref:hypothetical protein n=1 Tax=Serratia liquefaciens TaxID=614 RepID=UPI0021C9C8F6|nr:hypothetical protein [Serratia liquefaciens]
MKKGRPAYEHYLHSSWVEVRSGRQKLHTAKRLKRVAFLAEDFAQTGKEGEANGLHGWGSAHTVYNDCVNIQIDHVESPFYWSGPGKDWRLQPGLFNSEVPAGVAVEHAGTIAMAEFLDCSLALSADFPSSPAAAAFS